GVLSPTGTALGLNQSVGTSASFFPVKIKTGRSQHWTLNVQRELPGRWTLDVAYVGTHAYDLDRGSNIVNAIPANYFSTSLIRGTHRFAKGYSLNAVYTWSKLLERFGFDNDFQIIPNKQLSGNDIPHRVAVTFIGEAPFGRGRHWGSKMPGWLDAIMGGWQGQAVYQAQSGSPIDFGNRAFFGDFKSLHFKYDHNLVGSGIPMIDVSGFYLPTDPSGNPWSSPTAQRADQRIQLVNNIRYFPHNMSNTRTPPQNNIDLSVMKKFRAGERYSLELRGEFFNAFNHPWWTNPFTNPQQANFGTLDGNQRNLPRNVQLALKLLF